MVGAVDIGPGQKGQRRDDDGAVADIFGLDGQNEHQKDGGLRIEQPEYHDQGQQAGHHARKGQARRAQGPEDQTGNGSRG